MTHSNPYIKVVAGQSYTERIPKTVAVIGPYFGYDLINQRMGAGISFTIPLFTIKSK